jgi:hypothetical protein
VTSMWVAGSSSTLLAGCRLARVVDPDALAAALAQQAAGHAHRAIEHELQGALMPAIDSYRTAAALLERAALGSPHAGAHIHTSDTPQLSSLESAAARLSFTFDQQHRHTVGSTNSSGCVAGDRRVRIQGA